MKVILLGFLIITGFVALTRASAQVSPVQTVEQRYKNIQMFKGMPASDLEPTMAFISGSLGVRCNFCHTPNQFEKDDKPTKLAARKMIQMVFNLNKGSFNGDSAVSCFTCHRGKSKPVSVPVVGPNLWAPGAARKEEPAASSVDQILEKYVQAIGGTSAWQTVKSRVTKGSRIGADGVLVPEEVYQKAPNKLLTITSYPQIVFTNGFNGTTGWGHSSRDGVQQLPAEIMNQLKTEAIFGKELDIKKVYTDLRVAGGRDLSQGSNRITRKVVFRCCQRLTRQALCGIKNPSRKVTSSDGLRRL